VIQDTSGFAKFHVTFECIVFRPFKNEVLDCVVTSVNKMGFFAEAGPMQVFVSNYLIPEDMAFNSIDEPCYVSTDEMVRIQKDCEVRLRIVGTRNDANEIVRPRLALLGAPPLTRRRSSAWAPSKTTFSA